MSNALRPAAVWRRADPREEGSRKRPALPDRDGIYGDDLRRRVRGLGIDEVTIAYRSPWQIPVVDRLIGSIRPERLDHVIVMNQAHLRRSLVGYFNYYHRSRTRLSLDPNAPTPAEVESPSHGKVVAIPQVGRLHH